MTPDLRLDTQLCFALYSASRKVTSAYREPLSKMGLTYPQYLVLLVLWERDHRTVNQLGEALMLDSGTLSPLLRRMEGAGFVTRRRSAGEEAREHLRRTFALSPVECQYCVSTQSSGLLSPGPGRSLGMRQATPR